MTDALTAHASPSDSSFSRDREEDAPEQRESFCADAERSGARVDVSQARRLTQMTKGSDLFNSSLGPQTNQEFTASPPEGASTPTSFNFLGEDEPPRGPRRDAAPAEERAQTRPP